MDGYENCGLVLYCENFYISPVLFAHLQTKQLGAVGTVLDIRKGFPAGLKTANLPLKKDDDPVFSRSQDMVTVAWHDTKRVCLLSTIHTNNSCNKRVRCGSQPTGFHTAEKPVIADAYNSYMARNFQIPCNSC